MADSDSDDDLAKCAPSGLSQSSNASASPSPSKAKQNSPSSEEGKEEAATTSGESRILKRAQGVITKAKIAEEITSVNQLAWHKYVSKRVKQVYPVWKGSKDMIMHLAVQQEFDERKKSAVEYLAFGTAGKRAVVPKNKLIPYGTDGVWDANLMKDYLELLKKEGKLTELDMRKEELYLGKIVQVALAREHEKKVDTPVTPVDAADLVVEPIASKRDDYKIAVTTTERKNEPLRAGDVIEYTQPMYRGGDARGVTKAVVLSVAAGRKPNVLDLHNNEILPASHPVKRVLCRLRGKTIPNESASYRSIQLYKLVKSELKKEEREKFQKQTFQQLNDIIDRNLEKLQENAEKDGVGVFMDTMNVKRKSAKGTRNVEKVQAQLDKMRAQEGRRKVHYLPEALLRVALDAHHRMPEGETIETLAKSLKIDPDTLSAFLAGDEEKKVAMKKHKGTAATLRKWLSKQPAKKEEEQSSPPNKRARENIDNDEIKKIQAQLDNLRKQTGRRRSAVVHMTEELLELAIQVHRYMLKKNLSLDDVVEALDDETSDYSLSHFLSGDEGRIIRLASHEAMGEALTEWMARPEEEPFEESPVELEEEAVEMEVEPETETAKPADSAAAVKEAEVASSPEARTGSLHSVL